MKKEKTVRAYQRRTKSGKIVTVKQHTAKYDAAEALKEATKKKGAAEELDKLKGKAKESVSQDDSLGFTADDFKKWYHWDPVDDPKNTTALKVEKALKAKMGAKGYKKFFDEMTDSYSARGHNKAFKSLDSYKENSPKTPAKSSESSLKVGSTVRMGNSEFTTNDRKESFKVLATQKPNKFDRECGTEEIAWVQRKNGEVTLAHKESGEDWVFDDTWSGLTHRKFPYAKSLEAAGYSLSKQKGKLGDYWVASKTSKDEGEKKPEKSTESKQSNDSTPQKSRPKEPLALEETLSDNLKIGRKSYRVKLSRVTGEPMYSDGRSGWKTRDEIDVETSSRSHPLPTSMAMFSDSAVNKEPISLFRNYLKAVKGGKKKEIETARQHLQAAIDDAHHLTPEIMSIASNYDFSLEADRPGIRRLKKKPSKLG